MGPAVATERFFKTLNQIEKKLNRQEYEQKFLLPSK
jgi:hypothetical protein